MKYHEQLTLSKWHRLVNKHLCTFLYVFAAGRRKTTEVGFFQKMRIMGSMDSAIKSFKVSLVIPAYNEENYIGDCLDYAIKHAGGKFCEIIVVDNASTDKTAEIAKKKKGVRVVRENNKGLTKAKQRGLLEAAGDYIAYIDADTRLPENWFSKAEKFFKERENAVSLSGPYRYYDGSLIHNAVMTGVWWLSAPIAYRIFGHTLLGGNCIVKKKALHEMGGFNQKIKFYGEDTDISRRLAKLGDVVFRMDFFIYSSSRRFAKEGIIRTNFTYAMNFLWEAIFGRPFTSSYYQDIRTIDGTPKAGLKTWSAITGFALAGVLGWVLGVKDQHEALPLALFYAVLVLNTFFCVRLLEKNIPRDNVGQKIFDTLLVLAYFASGLSLGNTSVFLFSSLLLFIIATAKYVFLLDVIDQPKFLKRKIAIDLSGVMALALAFGGVFFGVPYSTWALAVVFGLANMLFLTTHPMYRLDKLL